MLVEGQVSLFSRIFTPKSSAGGNAGGLSNGELLLHHTRTTLILEELRKHDDGTVLFAQFTMDG